MKQQKAALTPMVRRPVLISTNMLLFWLRGWLEFADAQRFRFRV